MTSSVGALIGLGRRRLSVTRGRGLIGVGNAQVGLVLLTPVVVLALFGPWFTPDDPTRFVGVPYSSSSSAHWLGTDYQGRDVLSRFLAGGREIFLLALGAAALSVAVGLLLGLVAGARRGWQSDVILRVLDIPLVFPPLVLALLALTRGGSHWWLLLLVAAVAQVAPCARVIWAATTEVAVQDFVQAARALGVRQRTLLFAELLPNVTAALLVEVPIRFTYAVSLVSTLTFLGFGVQPPAADWGLMINENKGGLTLTPWAVLVPAIAIVLLAVGANLLADGVRQVVARDSAARS